MQWNDSSGNTGILQEILDSLEQPLTDTGRWSFALLLRRANNAMRDICDKTDCLKTIDTSTTSVAGTASYDKPSGAGRIIRVNYGNTPVYGIFEAELNAWNLGNNRDWQDLTDTPTRYVDRPESILLVPYPDTTGDTITFEYISPPTAMTIATSIPFDSRADLYAWHDLIAVGVVKRCLMDGKNADVALISKWEKLYNDGIKSLKKYVNSKPDTMMTVQDFQAGGFGNISPLPPFFKNR